MNTNEVALAAARVTLAELNTSPRTRTWSNYQLETRYAVGHVGPSWKQGVKYHLIRAEMITGTVDGTTPPRDHYQVGQALSTNGHCYSRGQQSARIVPDLDTDRITCTKCLVVIERTGARA